MDEFELCQEHRQKTLTTDLRANYNAEMCTPDVEKKRVVIDRTSKMRLDKEDTQQGNLKA